MTTNPPIIFYFSASGNSLALAKDIAKRISGTLVPIPAVVNKETIQPDSDNIRNCVSSLLRFKRLRRPADNKKVCQQT
ncbi:MAG TPA: flavodoxin family protein [Candidatus Bathyarchaeota archaeon]|nr:flavodoxin family protein [Candidatus Bathyarchaeota archaeon]